MNISAFCFVLSSLALIKNCVLRLFVSIFIDTSQSPHKTPYFSSSGINPFILLSFLIKIQSSLIVYSLLSFKYGLLTIHFVYSLYSFNSPPKPPTNTINLSFSLVKIQYPFSCKNRSNTLFGILSGRFLY